MSPQKSNCPIKTVTAATGLIAAIYFYFLIFAQFGFLGLLQEHGGGAAHQKWLLGLMALAGLGGSGSAAWAIPKWGAARVLRLGLFVSGLAAALAPFWNLGLIHGPVSLGIGLGVGWSTVSLITLLPDWLGSEHWGWKLGLGTGTAYFVCNVPAVFQASPATQSVLAAVVMLAALPLTMVTRPGQSSARPHEHGSAFPLWVALLSFVVLVWYDSAAFYIIQQTESLKGGTWGEGSLLYRNGMLHFLAAMAAGFLISRRHMRWLLLSALGCLVLAGHFVNQAPNRILGGGLYPIGVSLYSVCLLAYPAYLSGAADPATRSRHAAWIYAVAGWIASALGIGMAENLHIIPIWFILASSTLMIALHGRMLWSRFGREIAVIGAMAGLAWMASPQDHGDEALDHAVELGHRVYLSEGCIHCHSQYVRPGTLDEVMWGPTQSLESLLTNSPPLFGNRRQGPDLLRVANRRSPKWLKQHFISPQSLSHASAMPSYAHLFEDERGPALIAYLNSLAKGTLLKRRTAILDWSFEESRAEKSPDLSAKTNCGREIFRRHCSTCHGLDGRGDGPLSAVFPRPVGALSEGRFMRLPPTADSETRRAELARIIKFGIPGTEMPGHEYLSNSEIASLLEFMADWSSTKP